MSENQKLNLVLEGTVSVNEYKKLTIRNGKPQTYTTAKAKGLGKRWYVHVLEEVERQGWQIPNSLYLVRVTCDFYLPRINCDTHNMLKYPLDVIEKTGQVYENDSRVIVYERRRYVDCAYPRIEMEVTIDKQIGLFDNIEDYMNFTKTCEGCKNFKEGACNRLIGYTEARISDDVYLNVNDKWVCKKLKTKEGDI